MPLLLTPKCLVVDDDPLSLKLGLAACKKLNIDARSAADVHEMIDKLRERFFNLILLDNDIAGVRGHEVLNYAEKHLDRFTKIIVYSSSVNEADQQAYSKYGVAEYLKKPLNIDVLSFAIRRTLAI